MVRSNNQPRDNVGDVHTQEPEDDVGVHAQQGQTIIDSGEVVMIDTIPLANEVTDVVVETNVALIVDEVANEVAEIYLPIMWLPQI